MQRIAQICITLQQAHRSGDQRSERNPLLLAQEFFAGLVGPRKFLLQRHRFQAFREGVFVQRFALRFQPHRQIIRVALIVFAGNQFVLAARKKFHEIVQELPGIGQPPVFLQPQPFQISPQQNPVIELVQHHALWVGFRQQRLAEGMKCRQRHRFAAFSGGVHHPGSHFARGLLRERQAKNIFAGK